MATEFRTKELSVRFARNCIKLSVPYYIEAQLKKAACSVPQNLNEGAARHTVKDRHKFYRIALGSFREVEILIEILEIKNQELTLLQKQLGGSLVNLCKATE